MNVRALETWSYASDGRRTPPCLIVTPTWPEVEAALRRLDGRERPVLFLWASDDSALHMVDESSERLGVMGGPEANWVAGTFGGWFQRQLFDPDAGNDDIEVCPRHVEQGFAAPAKHVTRDLGLVLRVARRYFDHGEFDPGASWKQR